MAQNPPSQPQTQQCKLIVLRPREFQNTHLNLS